MKAILPDQLNRSNKHRGEVIEIYDNGMIAAVRFTSGRVECVKNPGSSPDGTRFEFFIGQKGVMDYMRVLGGYGWVFTPFKDQGEK